MSYFPYFAGESYAAVTCEEVREENLKNIARTIIIVMIPEYAAISLDQLNLNTNINFTITKTLDQARVANCVTITRDIEEKAGSSEGPSPKLPTHRTLAHTARLI